MSWSGAATDGEARTQPKRTTRWTPFPRCTCPDRTSKHEWRPHRRAEHATMSDSRERRMPERADFGHTRGQRFTANRAGGRRQATADAETARPSGFSKPQRAEARTKHPVACCSAENVPAGQGVGAVAATVSTKRPMGAGRHDVEPAATPFSLYLPAQTTKQEANRASTKPSAAKHCGQAEKRLRRGSKHTFDAGLAHDGRGLFAVRARQTQLHSWAQTT